MSRMSVIVLAIGVSLLLPSVTDRPQGRAAGKKENAPGGLLALRPGRLVQVFKSLPLSLHHDAPGEGLNKAQAKQQSEQQVEARRHQRHLMRGAKAQSSSRPGPSLNSHSVDVRGWRIFG